MPEDLEAALEWADHQSSVCSGCGHDKADTMNPDLMQQWDVVPVTCFACAARDRENRAAAAARSSGRVGDGALDGLFFAVTRRPEA